MVCAAMTALSVVIVGAQRFTFVTVTPLSTAKNTTLTTIINNQLRYFIVTVLTPLPVLPKLVRDHLGRPESDFTVAAPLAAAHNPDYA